MKTNAQAPIGYLLNLSGGDMGTAGLEYAIVEVDAQQLKRWQELMQTAQDIKEEHEGLLDVRLYRTSIGVCEQLPDEQPPAGELMRSIIQDLDVRHQVAVPGEILERVNERPARVGLSVLEVGEGRVGWTITPKHTDLEVGVATLYQDELERTETRLRLYDIQDPEKRQRQLEQICREDPGLGMSLLEEWNWLQQLEIQPKRWEGVAVRSFSPLLNHQDQEVRKKAMRLTGGQATPQASPKGRSR